MGSDRLVCSFPVAGCYHEHIAREMGSDDLRGAARSKTPSWDWYANRKAPIGGFHAYVQGCGEVRTRWVARGSAYQSVHADLGNTRLTDPIDWISRPSRPRGSGTPNGSCPSGWLRTDRDDTVRAQYRPLLE